ncbi:MAG: PstS family phosphate ABC transporter substrate-binding protein [Anaerolineae bacterium]|nr:PstS family phosphate ABC transporter substrate-binding protein [Anaerolineae bacterium]
MSGEIIIAGSSTVFPLSERLAERFQDEGFPGNVTIDSIGSGAGFERFCVSSETDITNASRPIKDSEREACRAIGRDPLEFRIGTDALAVVVSRDNNFVHDITLEQLAAVFSTAQTWSQVDPSWPDEPIQRFSPGTDSGTYDYFVEAVFDKDEEPLLRAENLQFSEDDNVLVKGIAGSPYAIGYFGYAYYLENADDLNLLSIDGVTASPEAIDQDIYPLARPLYIYSDAGIMRSKPQVAAFINFVLIYTNEEVISVGYFPASTAVLDTSIKIWMEAIQ